MCTHAENSFQERKLDEEQAEMKSRARMIHAQFYALTSDDDEMRATDSLWIFKGIEKNIA
jgi:hypothetical protein